MSQRIRIRTTVPRHVAAKYALMDHGAVEVEPSPVQWESTPVEVREFLAEYFAQERGGSSLVVEQPGWLGVVDAAVRKIEADAKAKAKARANLEKEADEVIYNILTRARVGHIYGKVSEVLNEPAYLARLEHACSGLEELDFTCEYPPEPLAKLREAYRKREQKEKAEADAARAAARANAESAEKAEDDAYRTELIEWLKRTSAGPLASLAEIGGEDEVSNETLGQEALQLSCKLLCARIPHSMYSETRGESDRDNPSVDAAAACLRAREFLSDPATVAGVAPGVVVKPPKVRRVSFDDDRRVTVVCSYVQWRWHKTDALTLVFWSEAHDE